eukprot:scaffold3952_cov116-Isochrysis_galbana.AAC.1
MHGAAPMHPPQCLGNWRPGSFPGRAHRVRAHPAAHGSAVYFALRGGRRPWRSCFRTWTV